MNVAAANPVMSVTTPPPSPTKTLLRSAPAASAARQMRSTVPTCFCRSPGSSTTSATGTPSGPSARCAVAPCAIETLASVTSRDDEAPRASSGSRSRSAFDRRSRRRTSALPAATAIGVAPPDLEDRARNGIGRLAVRRDARVGLGVGEATLREELGRAPFQGGAVEQRSAARLSSASSDFGRRRFERDDHRLVEGAKPEVARQERASPEGHDRPVAGCPRLLEHPLELLALDLAEAGLAVGGEDLGDALAEACLDAMVEIHEWAADPSGEQACDRRLSGRHRAADEKWACHARSGRACHGSRRASSPRAHAHGQASFSGQRCDAVAGEIASALRVRAKRST